jgi:GntR family transcriptional regulator
MPRAETASPLFAQVREKLKTRIADGSLQPGAKLPSEAELEQQFGVSRVTIRQALSELQALGLIEKVNGKGSFVREAQRRSSALEPLAGFYETMRRRGHVASGTVSKIERVEANPIVAAALRVPVSAPVGRIGITRIVDGEIHAFQFCYASRGLLEALTRENLEVKDLLTVLRQHLGFNVTRSHIDIEAIPASADMAKRLKTRPGAALMRIQFTTYDGQDTPLMFNEFSARGDRFRYRLNAGG